MSPVFSIIVASACGFMLAAWFGYRSSRRLYTRLITHFMESGIDNMTAEQYKTVVRRALEFFDREADRTGPLTRFELFRLRRFAEEIAKENETPDETIRRVMLNNEGCLAEFDAMTEILKPFEKDYGEDAPWSEILEDIIDDYQELYDAV